MTARNSTSARLSAQFSQLDKVLLAIYYLHDCTAKFRFVTNIWRIPYLLLRDSTYNANIRYFIGKWRHFVTRLSS